MATLAPDPMLRFEDNNGNPLVGGLLYTYQAGTTTPQATYTDYTGGTPNANPVVLNSRGEAPVWLTPGQAYKFVLKDSAGVTIYTVDQINAQQAVGVLNSLSNVSGTNTITATCTAISAYTAQQMFSGVALATNTGPATININSLGAVPLAINGIALTGGELHAGVPFILYYDGAKANIMANPAFPALGAINEAQGANLASAATVNLTAPGGNYLHITGTTAITAVTLPQGAERTVVFDGSLTLTNSGSLILPTGANIQTRAGDSATFRGEAASVVRCVRYEPANGQGIFSASIQGTFKNLLISTTGADSKVTVTADELAVENGNGAYATLRSISLSGASAIDISTTVAGGLDTGTLAGSTWYSVWVIWNPATGTKNGLISTADGISTFPMMPSGYTFKARVGWIRTDGTANKYPLSFKQYGRKVQYALVAGSNMTAYPVMASGVGGTFNSTTYTPAATAIANFVPSTASAISVTVQCGTTTVGVNVAASPSAVGGGFNSATCPPISANSSSMWNASGTFMLESTNIYYAANSAASSLTCLGWEDNL